MIALILLAAFAQVEDHKILDDPSRDHWQRPHEVLQSLALRADETVAFIGSGSGYFTRRVAHHPAKVYAVYIDANLLEIAKKNSAPNVAFILATPTDPKLAPASVDTIFICNVLHHIAARPDYYKKLQSALKPRGRIVVVDFSKKQLPVGPTVAMKLSEKQVEAEFAAAGFRLAKTHDFLPHQYFLEFRRQ